MAIVVGTVIFGILDVVAITIDVEVTLIDAVVVTVPVVLLLHLFLLL